MRERRWTETADPSEDGHPCEVAVALRLVAIRSNVVQEIPADVLDLAIQFAWIGKAVSRTVSITEWLSSGIDPNTREIVAAMAVDSVARQTALSHATGSRAAPAMADGLAAVRACQGFGQAVRVVRALCGQNPPAADVRRLSSLSEIARGLPDTKRLDRAKSYDGVISLDAFRKKRGRG
jgi:hypothetical protein